uniref:Latent-transforming growth factor beta-binding protein 1 n=1 Tax=Gopherus evgoodei TaxID=1825980 RepID=A0A8C4YIR6_9SAUR
MAGALARLLLPAALLLLPARLPPPAAQAPSQLRVLFTPTVCRVHCAGHRCTHRCERGNATVLYSGEPAGPAARATGFRVFLCPLLCQNGGVCIRKDQCLCPPSFTGKFCQIQSPRPQAPAPGQEVDSPGGAQPLTKSVYTLPLTNHQQERDGKGPWGGALSMVNVHVQHPPEASVIIHQVERVSEPSTPGEPPANALPPARPALYSVLAQSSPRTPPQLAALTQPLSLQCSAPLPGLRTQDICCRGAGVAWGKRLCGASPWPPVSLKHQSSQLPGPTLTPFRFSPDVDECQEGGFCQNGLCTNTPGSFSCLCHTGYILDSSRSSCISHHVISEAKGPCYRVLRDSTCSLPTLRNITKQICCCSRVGKAWGWGCERCPHFGSGEPRQMPGFSPGSRGGEPGRLEPPHFITAPPPPSPTTVPHPNPPTAPPSVPLARLSPSPTHPCSPIHVPPTAPPSMPFPRLSPPAHPHSLAKLCSPSALPPPLLLCPSLADIDECLTGSPCGPHGRCSNTEGSFRCECSQGYRAGAPGGPCAGKCGTRGGLTGPGRTPTLLTPSFADVNECLEGEFCFPHGECLNTDGSYTCLCAPGFAPVPSGTTCLGMGPRCPGTAVLPAGGWGRTQTSGNQSASCAGMGEDPGVQEPKRLLRGGWGSTQASGDHSASCRGMGEDPAVSPFADVDECQHGGMCEGGRCANTDGSFDCHCPAGFRTGPDKRACQDVDECANRTLCGDHAMCHNLPGSFHCRCDQGYEIARDGRHCQDVNECETLQGVCGAELCENVEGSFLCICPSSAQEFDPMTGRCTRLTSPPADNQPPALSSECYYQACEKVLARNATRQECCCSLGHAWGPACPAQPCPDPGTVEYQALCPRGNGYAAAGPLGALTGECYMDECALFSTQLCRGGVCVNKAPGYACYCPNGYYYETHHLECIDNDECRDEEAEPCVEGGCVNTIGSFYCACSPPLVLDGSQRRCVANDSQALDENQAVCWQEVGPDLVCSRPRLDRQVTYTECCCLYGEAWGMDCALCPARDSGEGPNPQTLPAAGGPAVKWGPGLRPDYDPYRFEGLRAEECGVLNGCENGQCVRVPHGFTCRCDPGFRLDTAHMACLDIDECAEAEGPPALCLNGRCLNTDGSYRCLCPRGYVLSQPPPSCIPARPRA